MEPAILTVPIYPPDPRDTLPDLFSHGQWRRLSSRLGLSRRQAQIAIRLASEMSRDDIGRELGITLETVRTHTRSLFQKLGVRSRVGLIISLIIQARQLPLDRDKDDETDGHVRGNGRGEP